MAPNAGGTVTLPKLVGLRLRRARKAVRLVDNDQPLFTLAVLI